MTRITATALSDFQTIGSLGNGSFAEVLKVRRKEDGQIYALKKIRMAKIKEKDKNNALNEIRILASEGGENIIAFKEAFYDEGSSCLCIVMEFAEKGDLLQLIHSHTKNSTRIEEEEIWKALVHISKGLKSLHDKKILHRDLKGANVFITGEGVYKLGDMNVSKVVKYDLARTQTGTPYYASPEVWKDLPYGTKSDMWSLGCVLYEMAAHRPPFTANDIQTLYKRVMGGYYPRIPAVYSSELSEIINSLLQMNPSDRPSVSELLNNSVVQSHYCEQGKKTDWWQAQDLLSTIRFPQSKNYKQINDILPPAKYAKKVAVVESTKQETTIVGSFFCHSQSKEKMPPLKEEISTHFKYRVRSLHENQEGKKCFKEISSNVVKRERIASYAQPVKQVEESSINKIDIFRDIPSSQKIPKKNPEIPSIVKSPALSKNVSRVDETGEKKGTQTCRRKVESVIHKILSSQTSRCRNKENLRRIGQQIVSGVASRKDVGHLC